MTNIFSINLHELIHGRIIEWERLEFKEGWNPEAIMHTLCAFANDIHNLGGGYIFIGVPAKLPLKGLEPDSVDKIQKELVNICNRIQPHYFPIVMPTLYQGKHIIAMQCPGGDVRPYKAPVSLSEHKTQYAYYIRRNSCTVRASTQDEHLLLQLAQKVPFDDRIQHFANPEDLNLPLIKTFLKEVKSSLYERVDQVSFQELCTALRVIKGSLDFLRPVNIGVLMFSQNPEKFLPGARIEIVEFHDEIGDRFTEKTFSGPIHVQLRDALQYMRNSILKERIEKVPEQAEAMRFFNYPFVAIEEALANAVYHKGYDHPAPIEIRIEPGQVQILSFPGPLPPIKQMDLTKEKIVAREYRNRRIGDFLKELHLTEGRCTGIPKIQKAMRENGSSPAILETNERGEYFLTTLPSHPAFLEKNQGRLDAKQGSKLLPLSSKQSMLSIKGLDVLIEKYAKSQAHKMELMEILDEMKESFDLKVLIDLGSRESPELVKEIILKLCKIRKFSASDLAGLLRRNSVSLRRLYLKPLVDEGKLKLSIQNKNAPNQSYYTP